jgi:protein associated with RNAse G/E
MADITVLKLNLEGFETWRYTGEVLRLDQEKVVLQALFNRQDTPFHGIILKKGDRFIETFYLNRWYNIFEIHDRDDDHLKGWYCNIGHPAKYDGQVLSYIDLALDLLVYPDGKQLVLDEDEFAELNLPAEISRQALNALDQLRESFAKL